MKKLLLIFVVLFLVMNLFGQVRNFEDIPKDILKHLDKMGIDDSLVLNKYESAYFNAFFRDSLKEFDFMNKKIGFIQALVGKISKQEYFKDERERYCSNITPISATLYVFDEKQKEESGGYDAAIMCWSKIFIPIEKIVKRLKKQP